MLRRQRDYQFFSLRGALHEQMVSCTSNEQMLHVQRKDAARAMSSPCTCRDKTFARATVLDYRGDRKHESVGFGNVSFVFKMSGLYGHSRCTWKFFMVFDSFKVKRLLSNQKRFANSDIFYFLENTQKWHLANSSTA